MSDLSLDYDEFVAKPKFYYLNITRMLIFKSHPKNKDTQEEYTRLNDNLLNNLKSHLSKCDEFKDIEHLFLVKEIGDVNETPHIHSIIGFESKEKLIRMMKYVQTRILKAYKDDVSIVPHDEVPYYLKYMLKTWRPNWKEYKNYFIGSKKENIIFWNNYLSHHKFQTKFIDFFLSNPKAGVKNEDLQIKQLQTERILKILVKHEDDGCLFTDD